jgi:hypothetical protein
MRQLRAIFETVLFITEVWWMVSNHRSEGADAEQKSRLCCTRRPVSPEVGGFSASV